MLNFIHDFKFIIFFLILVLAIGTFTNEKILYYFLLLILIGMVIKQSGAFTNLLKKYEGGMA